MMQLDSFLLFQKYEEHTEISSFLLEICKLNFELFRQFLMLFHVRRKNIRNAILSNSFHLVILQLLKDIMLLNNLKERWTMMIFKHLHKNTQKYLLIIV